MASSRRTATNENISTYGGAGQGRDYTSLDTWEAATGNDLVTAEQSEVLECYADESSFDDHFSNTTGATTNASYYRIVRPAGTKGEASWQGHNGTPNTGVKFDSTIDDDVFFIFEDYTSIEDIIATMHISGSGDKYGFITDISTDGNRFVGCIVDNPVNTASGNANGIAISADGGRKQYAINCIVIGADDSYLISTSSGGGSEVNYVYNCVSIDASDQGFRFVGGTATAINCLSTGSTTADFDNEGDNTDLTGSKNNASGDATAVGTDPRIDQAFTFVSSGNDDYHLASNDVGAREVGFDLSADGGYAFDDDIDWQTRPICSLTDRTDNTYWTAMKGSWDGSEWDSEPDLGEVVILEELGTWVDGYRPASIIVTYTGGLLPALVVIDKNTVYILDTDIGFTSGQKYLLSFVDGSSGSDINDINVIDIAPFSVQSIQFCDEGWDIGFDEYTFLAGWSAGNINTVTAANLGKVNTVLRVDISTINTV